MENQETSSQNSNSPLKEKVEKTTQENKSPAETPTSNSSSWWGGWISQAKEKSASVLEAVKNDLNEITTAVTETLHLNQSEDELLRDASSDSNDLQQQDQQQHPSTVNFANMKQSISSSISTFFGSVTDALIPQMDEEDVSEAILITGDDTIVLTGFTKYLAELQANDETYLEEPSKTAELAEKYRMWLEVVEQDQFTQQRVDKMLQQSQILNEKYNKFVPNTVSHMNFFKRYLFKKALLEDDLANEERRKKEMIIETQPEPTVPESIIPSVEAQIATPQTTPSKKNEIKDLDITNYEISEEEQARLLEEYEQEIKEREKNKTEDDILIPDEEVEPTPKPKAQKSTKKSAVQPKATVAATTKGKHNKDSKTQQHQQKSNQQKTKNTEKAKGAQKKSDEPLPIEKDHFKKESDTSTSDESWEKDFDM